MNIPSFISRLFRPPAIEKKQLSFAEKLVQRVEDLEVISDCSDRVARLEAKLGIPGSAPAEK